MLEALEGGVRSGVPTMVLAPVLLLRSHKPRDTWGPACPSSSLWYLCQLGHTTFSCYEIPR